MQSLNKQNIPAKIDCILRLPNAFSQKARTFGLSVVITTGFPQFSSFYIYSSSTNVNLILTLACVYLSAALLADTVKGQSHQLKSPCSVRAGHLWHSKIVSVWIALIPFGVLFRKGGTNETNRSHTQFPSFLPSCGKYPGQEFFTWYESLLWFLLMLLQHQNDKKSMTRKRFVDKRFAPVEPKLKPDLQKFIRVWIAHSEEHIMTCSSGIWYWHRHSTRWIGPKYLVFLVGPGGPGHGEFLARNRQLVKRRRWGICR